MKEVNKEANRLSNIVIGAAIEVHRHLGPGFLEAVYEHALCIELQLRNISFIQQAPIKINYKGHDVGEGRLDLLVGNVLIVELKAVEAISNIHTAQIMSYLKATGIDLGLLINFNVPILKDGIKRIALS